MSAFRGRIAGAGSRDLRGSAVSPSIAHAAIRDWSAIAVGGTSARSEGRSTPEFVGLPTPELGPDERDAYDVLGPVDAAGPTDRQLLAAAGRIRGSTTPHDEEIRHLEEELNALELPEFDTTAKRRAAVAASRDEAKLRERIAALRGRLRTERELGKPTDETSEMLAKAAADLSEASTGRIAAEQALREAERNARTARDARDRRLKLQDRIENRRREAREFLADALASEFDAALDRVDVLLEGPTDAPGRTSAQLAAVAIADLQVPIVIDAGATGIRDAERAGRLIGTSVWLCEP